MAYFERGVVKSNQATIWHLKTITEFFWTMVNSMCVFFAAIFSMEKSYAYKNGYILGNKSYGVLWDPESQPNDGSQRGLRRGSKNVLGLKIFRGVQHEKAMETDRVQDIASIHKDTIPEEFIRSAQEQPAITTVHGVNLEVPVIDMSDPDEEKINRAIINAGKKWGMFQIINHGIPIEVVKKLQSVGRQFFELPQEEKEIYAKPKNVSGVVEGYGTLLQKEIGGKKGWVDHLFHKIWPPHCINYQFWPKTPPSYREANEEYRDYLHDVVRKLFKSLSTGLGLEEKELKEAVGGEELIYLLKINYYPPCPRPDLALGVTAHTDMSCLTLLVPNEVQGLQACRDGQWYDVKYIPNALVVHIGDQMEIVSNGQYRAVLHRTTVNKENTRMSWPVFLEPPSDHEVGPHPKLVNENNPPKYKTKKFGDYCYCKLNKIPQ